MADRPNDILTEFLVHLMQGHVQQYGPLPDAVATALKAALAALAGKAPQVEPAPSRLPERPIMVLKRSDGFEMRLPCPYGELPYAWVVPEHPKMSSTYFSSGDQSEHPSLRHTRFVRGRRLSETEFEYLED